MPLAWPACGGGAAGAKGFAEGHATPAGGETAAAGGAEAARQGEGAGEGDMLPSADTQPGLREGEALQRDRNNAQPINSSNKSVCSRYLFRVCTSIYKIQ